MSLATINIVVAELVGFIVQSLLYGIYLLLSAASMYCLYYVRGKNVKPSKVVVAASVTLFLMVTMFYILSLIRIIFAFGMRLDNVEAALYHPGGSVSSVGLMRNAVYCSTIILIDILLTYRLYVMYMYNIWIIVLPILATIGSVVGTCVQVMLLSQGKLALIWPWVVTNIVLSMLISSYAAFLIIFRVFQEGHVFRQFGIKNIFIPILYTTVESAFLTSALLVISLIFALNVESSGATFMFLHFVPPVIGINYSAILIRIGLGFSDVSKVYVASFPRSRVSQVSTTSNRPQHPIMLPVSESSNECESFKVHKIADRADDGISV